MTDSHNEQAALPRNGGGNGRTRKDVIVLDIPATLSELLRSHDELKQLVLERPHNGGDDDGADALEKKVSRAQSVGTVISWVAAAVALLFSAGVAWAVFLGANATDAEVEAATDQAIIDHNGGIDPAGINPTTGRPYGNHSDMRDAIDSNAKAVREIRSDVRKLDKRSEYQFELGRWQSKVTEAERKKHTPPPKPQALEDLERDIMLGQFAD